MDSAEDQWTVAYLGGPQCDGPPLWLDHENFLQATLYEKVRFLPFSSKNCKIQQCLMVFCVSKFQKKWANLRFPLNIQKQNVFQLQGGFAPWLPDQGLCPWTPLGAPPPDPRYRLTLRALAMAPLCQILNTPLSMELGKRIKKMFLHRVMWTRERDQRTKTREYIKTKTTKTKTDNSWLEQYFHEIDAQFIWYYRYSQ